MEEPAKVIVGGLAKSYPLEIHVHPEHAEEVRNDPEKLATLEKCARSFREFLNYWTFVNQETGEQAILGEELWSGQEQVIEGMESVPKLFALKARKLGFTTIEQAFDAWVARFRDKNARVHLFSRRDDAAKELLASVKYGLDRLPPWMKLPYNGVPTKMELELYAGKDDIRLVKSYPPSKETAVEKTATHAHVDEWARMQDPESFWQAVEPSFAGSAHIITTGRGPQNFASIFWKDCLAGDTDYVPIFVYALDRPDRDDAWLERMRKGRTEEALRQEFPMTWEDALFAGGRFTYKAIDIDVAGLGEGPKPPAAGHRYVKSWDIGRHQDAAVGIVFDVTEQPTQIVEYMRLREMPYPHLQKLIERTHFKYPGQTVIEKNNAGEAVAENLDNIPERAITLFNTGKVSKARILEELQIALENRAIKWSKRAWPQLDNEVRGYQVPDDNIVQDSVMALAIGIGNLSTAYTAGRVGTPTEIG